MNINPAMATSATENSIASPTDGQIESMDSMTSIDNLDINSLAGSAMGMVSNVYDQHNFLISVLQDETKDDMSPEMLRTIQNSLEKFTVQTQLIGKVISVAVKGLETLTQLQ